MLLRPLNSRFPSPLSWSSRSLTMPLRAKVTNPAFGSRMISTPATIPKELPEDEADDVLFHSHYGVRLVELNRPKKLNALNGSMARKILPRLLEWEKSQLANIVMISGAGEKAFCAGGDVAALATSNQKGPEGQQKSTEYFGLEYQLDHLIATYSKPYVAVMDGITMGGGVGLSVHAPFRIATERTVFAMPETTIGFFPDVGGSFFLSRLDGQIGTYLALTSERLKGVQTLYSGIATHYIDSSVLSNLTNRLSELVFKDYATMEERLSLVNKTINEFSTGLPSIEQEPILPDHNIRQAIDRCFDHNTIEEIASALKKEIEKGPQNEWAEKTLKTLLSRSPTSLKVTLRQLRLGKKWSISETFRREYAIAAKFMRHPDFVEGVSARLVSKPPRDPKWSPPQLDKVTNKDVDAFFATADEELALFNDIDYESYPHAKYALPPTQAISQLPKDPAAFFKTWGKQEGLREKTYEVFPDRAKSTIDGWFRKA